MRERLTYGNVVTVLALVAVVAGGTAAALPGKNSVQSNDLKKNSVKARAIAADAVRSGEIQDGSVNGQEVADRGLNYGDLASNSVVARVRSTSAVSTAGTTDLDPAIVPLSSPQWQQAPTETQVFFGELKASQTADCGAGTMNIDVLVDGENIENFSADEQQAGPFTRVVFSDRQYLFETGATETHTMAVTVYDDCPTGADFTIDSFAVDVVGMR